MTVGIDIGSITKKIAMINGGKLLNTDVALSGCGMDEALCDILAKIEYRYAAGSGEVD